MPICPSCGKEINTIVKDWKYSVFHVKKYVCDFCDATFNIYFHKGKFNHVIYNKGHGQINKIISYLSKHDSVCTEKIAKDLNLSIAETFRLLMLLEKKGRIERLLRQKIENTQIPVQ